MFGLGIGESVLILAIVILLFGGSRLPALGSAFGKSIKNFKKGMKEGSEKDTKEAPLTNISQNNKKSDSQNDG